MKFVGLSAMLLCVAASMGGQADTAAYYVKKYPKGSVDYWQWVKPGVGTVKAESAEYIGNSVWKLRKATIDNETAVITADEIDFNTSTFEGATYGNALVTLRKHAAKPN